MSDDACCVPVCVGIGRHCEPLTCPMYCLFVVVAGPLFAFNFSHVGFCGDAGPGTLSVAQEQDVQGGAYELVDAADIIIDTIAIYDTYWTSTQVRLQVLCICTFCGLFCAFFDELFASRFWHSLSIRTPTFWKRRLGEQPQGSVRELARHKPVHPLVRIHSRQRPCWIQ